MHQRTSLRQLIEARLNMRWSEWASSHQHLAQVIDRTRLLETTVQQLASDAQYQAALRQADLDEQTLAAAAEALGQIDRLIERVLPL